MKITLFVIILILIILLRISYRRNSAARSDSEKSTLVREVLLDISDKMSENRDPLDLYQHILEACLKLIPKAKSGSIFLVDSEGLLTAVASAGFNSSEIMHVRFRPEETLLAAATGGKADQTVVINRVEEVVQKNDLNWEYSGFAVHSEIAAPLQLDGGLAGMLCIDGDQIDIFSDQDAHMLDYMANQIGLLLKNQKLYDEIRRLSRYDSLTHLLNRISFEREAVKLLSDPSKNMETLYFVLIELDDLKTANEALGHHVGDEIIRALPETVAKYLGRNDLFGRYSGDEFAVVIQGDSVKVNEILEESKKEFATRKYGFEGNSFTPGFRYGKASFKEGQCDLNMLCGLADRRMQEMRASKSETRPIRGRFRLST